MKKKIICSENWNIPKRKKLNKKKNEIFFLLKEKGNYFNNQQFIKILNCLEFTFRKKLKGMEKAINKEVFHSIKNKIPLDWMGVKYSSIKRKKEKDEREQS